jgi:hypothetical protein
METARFQLIGVTQSTTRLAQETELDDIFGLLDYIDGQGSLKELQIVASDLDRIPRCDTKELNPLAFWSNANRS